MDVVIPLLAVLGLLIFFFVVFQKIKDARRKEFILNYKFPHSIKDKVKAAYPHLKDSETDQVMKALVDYFLIIHSSKAQVVAMPSQVVDLAWHEFILFTKKYDLFCRKSFGYFLHHTPAEAMKSQDEAQVGIKRAWKIACFLSTVSPYLPKKLPLIFAIDARLNIKDGFHYQINCKRLTSNDLVGAGTVTVSPGGAYCVNNIGCVAGCSGSNGCSGGDAGGTGGGCGGN